MCPPPPSSRRSLASTIDHTLLKPDALASDVRRVVEEAAQHRFAAVCIPPCYVMDAAELLGEGSPVAIATVVSFPFGYSTPQARLDASRRALEDGARELDTVINISRLKSGEDGWVLDDLSGWVEALRAGREAEVVLKVILETALLSDDEKHRAAQLVVDSGADYVKTSTGFAGGGATVEDVELLAKVVAGRAKIKASGGIRDRETAWAMIDAGADRLGTSSGVALVAEEGEG